VSEPVRISAPRGAVNTTCIVVADAKRARFFSIEASDTARHPQKLVEGSVLVNPGVEGVCGNGAGPVKTERFSNRQAGPVHPIGAQRERHRLELERRFGREIASQARKITGAWASGAVVLIAAPRLLGLMREGLRDALHSGIELKELAKDYTSLSAAELRDRLAIIRLV
jgi:protein required for attachment to host cells